MLQQRGGKGIGDAGRGGRKGKGDKLWKGRGEWREQEGVRVQFLERLGHGGSGE